MSQIRSKQDAARYRVIFERLAELENCFPSIAPRLILNLNLDTDLNTGFDTPLLKVMARHQIPVLLEAFLQIGAFVPDTSRKCGYRPVLAQEFAPTGAEAGMEAQQVFRDYADVMSERMARGNPYKLAAVNVPMSDEILEKIQSRILPVLQQLASESDVQNGVGVKLVFGCVHDQR